MLFINIILKTGSDIFFLFSITFYRKAFKSIISKMAVACEFVCWEEKVGKEALCTHRIRKKVVAQKHTCR